LERAEAWGSERQGSGWEGAWTTKFWQRDAAATPKAAGKSRFEAEGELLDDRVGEDLARDAFDFGLGLGGVLGEGVFEGELEVLSLADVGDSAVLHAAERAGDSLALGIEHGPLQSDVHMRLHEV
jgi:hypothetical protein